VNSAVFFPHRTQKIKALQNIRAFSKNQCQLSMLFVLHLLIRQ
jgi:hypothetical protein